MALPYCRYKHDDPYHITVYLLARVYLALTSPLELFIPELLHRTQDWMPKKATKESFSMKPVSKLTSGEVTELMKPLIFGDHQKHFRLFSWAVGLGVLTVLAVCLVDCVHCRYCLLYGLPS